jgi:hypothetical protein
MMMQDWMNLSSSHFIFSFIVSYGAATPYFNGHEPTCFREFLEAICVEESPSRGVFGLHQQVGRKSLTFLHKYPLMASIRTWILFSLRFSKNCYLCHRHESHRDLLYYALSKSQLSKVSSIFTNILIAILVLACSRLLAGIKDLH